MRRLLAAAIKLDWEATPGAALDPLP